MNIKIKNLFVVFASLLVFALVLPAYADVVGDWEGAADSWTDRVSGLSIDDASLSAMYQYDTFGATLGSQSIKLTSQDYVQTLELALTSPEQRDAFLANGVISVDLSIKADVLGVGGYARIEHIIINSEIGGWQQTDVTADASLYFTPGSLDQSITLQFNYSSLKSAIGLGGNWLEIIFVTNGERETLPDATPFELYLDNVQFLPAPDIEAVVIGDFEGAPDGWIDWGNQLSVDTDPNNMPVKYEYGTIGATLGSQSLQLKGISGWSQSLGIKLDATQRAEFLERDTFSIDITVPAADSSLGGWIQIENLVINSDGGGWLPQLTEVYPLGFSLTSPQTTTLVIDYTAAKAGMPASPTYLELIFETNAGTVEPSSLYFDNAVIYLDQEATPDSYEAEVMADNPILYLKFDSLTPEDSSGNNYWSEYRGGAAVVTGGAVLGAGAIHLDGSNQGSASAANQTTEPTYDTFGDEFAFAPDDITFEFWTKIEAMNQYGFFFQQIKTDEATAPGIGNSAGTIRVLNGGGDPGGDQSFWYTGVTTPIDNEWHHMVLTYDEQYGGDPNAMGVQLYLDGVAAGSTVASPYAALGPELSHLVIGGENDRGYIWNTMTGFIDEFAIYAGVLDSDRIAAHYASGIYERAPKTCAEVWQKGLGLPGDADKDCDVDLYDFALMSMDWNLCNDPNSLDPECIASW